MENLEEDAKRVIRSLKPIERLVPEKPPFIACGEYLTSKKFTRELPRDVNFDHISERSVATKYHFLRKEYNNVEGRLRETKKKAKEQQKLMDKEWKQLYDQEKELRNSFEKFNKFMEENEQKRKRATQKNKEMSVVLKERSEEVEMIKKECDKMKELTILLDNDIKKCGIYGQFLTKVAKLDPVNFGRIDAIFSRYTALVKAKRDLTDRHENYMQELERIRDATTNSIMEKFVQLKGLSNTITDLHKRFEAVQIKAKNAELFHQQAFLEAQKKVLELQYVKDSCEQIYENICIRRNKPPVYKNNTIKQLEVIKKALRSLNLVNRMVEAINDEKLTPPTERDSSGGDSVVANVVTRFLFKK